MGGEVSQAARHGGGGSRVAVLRAGAAHREGVAVPRSSLFVKRIYFDDTQANKEIPPCHARFPPLLYNKAVLPASARRSTRSIL